MSDSVPQAVAEGWVRTVEDLAKLSARHRALLESIEALTQEMSRPTDRVLAGENAIRLDERRWWAKRIDALLKETP